MRTPNAALLAVLALCACGPSRGNPGAPVAEDAGAPPSDVGEVSPSAPPAGRAQVDAGATMAVDPLLPLAPEDTDAGLTNVSTDLKALLENGAMAGACDRYDHG